MTLRPNDYDKNGDIIPMACKEEKGDTISRSALKDEINKKVEKIIKAFNGYAVDSSAIIYTHIELLDLIDNAPTVEIATKLQPNCNKLQQGEWIEGENGIIKCNKCKSEIIYSYLIGNEPDFPNFCPNCGADMRGEDNG